MAAACAMALVLHLTWHRSRNSLGLPVILVGGVVAAHIAFWFTGIIGGGAGVGLDLSAAPACQLHVAMERQ
jgi:sulfate permease, SulP family